MLFVLQDVAGVDEVAGIPGFEDYGYDTAAAVLEESAKFCNEVVAPLNWDGDQQPSSLKDGVVTTTPGFKEAFKQFVSNDFALATTEQLCDEVLSLPIHTEMNSDDMNFVCTSIQSFFNK